MWPLIWSSRLGPHLVLKGAAQQTITDVFPSEVPCVGLLNRSQSGIESLAKAIGALGPDSTLSPDHTPYQQKQTVDLIATLYIK